MPASAPALLLSLMGSSCCLGRGARAEHPRGELGIKACELRRNGLAKQGQCYRRGERRLRHLLRAVEREAGLVEHFLEAVTGMHALEPEPRALAVEREMA